MLFAEHGTENVKNLRIQTFIWVLEHLPLISYIGNCVLVKISTMLIEYTPKNEQDRRRWAWLFPITNSRLAKEEKKSRLNLCSAT